MIKIYMARGMTGRIKSDVVKEALEDKEWFERAGLIVLDPVAEEGVKNTKEVLISSQKDMVGFWARDKEMIRESHIVFDMTPHLNSEGVKHELGYARYHLWKPIIRIFPFRALPTNASVAFFEDDVVVDSKEEALEWVLRVYGTPFKRLKWKLALLNRCFIGFLGTRIVWFFNWV